MAIKSPIRFRGFDERGDVRIYSHGMLPHWRQEGCTYFVTFRQADALPQPVLRELEHERCLWLRHHGISPESPSWKQEFAKLAKEHQREYERRVGLNLDRYLDAGYGTCTLRNLRMAEIVADSLDHFHEQRVWTGDFVVMPNHVHALMTPIVGFELEDILHSVKSYTANRINRCCGQRGTFWQKESYDHIVRDFDQLDAFQRYTAANPKKARLAEHEFLWKPASYIPDEQ